MNKAPIYVVISYLIFATYLQLPEITQYDSKRLLQIIIFFVAGSIITINFFFKKHICDKGSINIAKPDFSTNKYLMIAISILLISGLVSVIFSERIQFALLEFGFLLVLIALIFLIKPVSQKAHLFLGKVIVVTAILYSSLYLLVFFGKYISSFLNPMVSIWPGKYSFDIILSGIQLEGKETLFFDHKRFFNHTQTWTLPILIGFLCYYKNKFTDRRLITFLITLLVSFWWMLIFASGGRGSTLSIILSVIILTIIWKKDLIPFLRQGLISLSVGAISYFVFFKLIPDSGSSTPLLRSSDSGRFSMWESAFDMWWQNPLFGVGPMHYSQITTAPTFAHPHNFYIQFLSEWGIIAFLALAALLIILVKFVLKNYPADLQKFQTKYLYIAASWSLLAAFIHAFFSGVFHTPMSQIWFVLITAWFLGFNRKKYSKSHLYTVNKYSSIVFLILLLTLSIILYDDIWNIYQGYEDYVSKYPESKFYPRFWGQGLFD